MSTHFADTPDSEHAWLRQARAGDHAAFAAIYLKHSPGVYTLALRLSGQRSEADDLTQETFLRALQSLAGFRDGAALGPWLKRITANLAIDRLRRLRPHDPLEDVEIAGETTDHDGRLDLAAAMAGLDALTRSVVWLAVMEGWSHRELADRHGRTESWSKSVLSRALSRLKLGWEDSR
jgi:RNA polymerase sigma-70 factor (ECF subfamily)